MSVPERVCPIPRFTGDTPGDYTDLKLSNPDISVEDGTLSINNIQKTNEGYYLCEAVNGIGAGLSAVIFISVQGIPSSVLHPFLRPNLRRSLQPRPTSRSN